MTTKLNKADRQQVIERVLRDAFEPRFNALAERLREAALASSIENDRIFYELHSDPENRKYLHSYRCNNFYIGDADNTRTAMAPIYGLHARPPAGRYALAGCKRIESRDFVSCFGNTATVTDSQISADYDAAWEDYGAAYTKMSSLLASYSNRERFIEDFPEFAKHLPPPSVPARLPSVIVGDVLADLAKLGVPKKQHP